MLIGFMGGLNHPDLATRAGEEPLPQSDDSDIGGEQMDTDGEKATDEEKLILVAPIDNALSSFGDNAGPNKHLPDYSKEEYTRPTRPTILTSNHGSSSKDEKSLDLQEEDYHYDSTSNPTAASSRSVRIATTSAHSPARVIPSRDDSGSVAISPMLRRFTIPNSERSPTETLPAMHGSPTSATSRSPNGQQNLPSLRAIALELALDSRSPNEIATHGMGRSAFSGNNGSLNSPPVNSRAPRHDQPTGAQGRINERFSPHHASAHPSPANHDTSPREPTAMSPPIKPPFQGYQTSRRTPHSEESTPQSAESHNSSSSFSTAPSPHTYPLDSEGGRPTLPPLAGLSNGPIMTGSFKCDYAGCTAAPFQTQYLLK